MTSVSEQHSRNRPRPCARFGHDRIVYAVLCWIDGRIDWQLGELVPLWAAYKTGTQFLRAHCMANTESWIDGQLGELVPLWAAYKTGTQFLRALYGEC